MGFGCEEEVEPDLLFVLANRELVVDVLRFKALGQKFLDVVTDLAVKTIARHNDHGLNAAG